jgi:hypothetical protein
VHRSVLQLRSLDLGGSFDLIRLCFGLGYSPNLVRLEADVVK